MKIRFPKTSTMVAAAAIAIGLTAGGVGVIQAASNADSSNTSPMSNLVTAISTKFNLNQTEVQQVFDEQMQERGKQKLTQLVADGKLTQEQADKIVAKHAELHAQRQGNRAELEQWAKDNNIPLQYLRSGLGGHVGHDGQGKGMRFDKN